MERTSTVVLSVAMEEEIQKHFSWIELWLSSAPSVLLLIQCSTVYLMTLCQILMLCSFEWGLIRLIYIIIFEEGTKKKEMIVRDYILLPCGTEENWSSVQITCLLTSIWIEDHHTPWWSVYLSSHCSWRSMSIKCKGFGLKPTLAFARSIVNLILYEVGWLTLCPGRPNPEECSSRGGMGPRFSLNKMAKSRTSPSPGHRTPFSSHSTLSLEMVVYTKKPMARSTSGLNYVTWCLKSLKEKQKLESAVRIRGRRIIQKKVLEDKHVLVFI
jgi:hypothetical protein